MANVKWVGACVHTCGDPNGRDTTAAAIRKYHITPVADGGRGWRDIGYNVVIRMNGDVEQGRPLDDDAWCEWDEIGAHARGANDRLFGIVCTGNGDQKDFTPAQHATLAREIARRFFGWGLDESHVYGHREVMKIGAPNPFKTCPGKLVNCDTIRANVRAELAIRRAALPPGVPLHTATDNLIWFSAKGATRGLPWAVRTADGAYYLAAELSVTAARTVFYDTGFPLPCGPRGIVACNALSGVLIPARPDEIA